MKRELGLTNRTLKMQRLSPDKLDMFTEQLVEVWLSLNEIKELSKGQTHLMIIQTI